MDNTNGEVWDPLNTSINDGTFFDQQKSLIDKVNNYRKKPNVIIIYLIVWIALPILVIVLLLLNQDILFSREGIEFIILSAIPLFVYHKYINHLQEEVVLCLLCEKNHWIYNPNKDDDRLSQFITSYPQVFNIGHSQKIEDQIWGSLPDKKVNFWKGSFTYTIGYGKSSQTYTRAILIMRLNFSIPINFSLVGAGLFPNLVEKFKTESEDFNSRFRIICDNNDMIAKTEIIKVLSPSVLVRFINFSKMYFVESIHFQENVMIVIFSNEIWRTKYTNFYKNVAIDERDETLFFGSIQDATELPAEMIQFIN